MKKITIISILLALIFNISTALSQDAKYHFVRIDGLAEQAVAEKILKEIYNKMGIAIDIQALPGERAKLLATNGEKDGETLRIFSYGEKNKTMVRVPTPYSSLETTAFAKKSSNIAIKTKDDLKKYKIVIVRGVQHTKDMTEGLSNVHVIDNSEMMMKFLELGRADVALTNTISGLAVLKKLGNSEIVPVGTLETLDLFHYLNEKNKDIVPKVDEAVKSMTTSGEIKQLREKYEKEYLDSIQIN